MSEEQGNRKGKKGEMPSFTTGAEQAPEMPSSENKGTQWTHILGGIFSLMIFMLGIHTMSGSFQLFGKDWINNLIQLTSNPFISLFVGLLATALVQSSSTTTSVIVTLVATNGLSIESAIPLIMGANIGTAVTSTIVALGHIGNKEEFQKAVAGASVHDMFNILTTLVLFILELTTGFFSSMAASLAEVISPLEGGKTGSLFYPLKLASEYLIQFLGSNPVICLLVALAMLFLSIRGLTWMLRTFVIGQLKKNLNKYVFERPLNSFLTGIGLTLILQSSSVTTSLMVPLIATGRVRLKHAFPFIMGANIGTTSTAILAALFNLENSEIALTVAFVHLFFNLLGVLIFLPFKRIRMIPIKMAQSLGNLAKTNRVYGVIYVMLFFFGLPVALIFIGTFV
ncbi:MAG: Na/Pi symporter [Bacteroidia bacterium]|nr:Na/Pi symporter [Bacteroidia bacterium]